MLLHRSYLLIIDGAPWEEQFVEYFAKFNYEIIQVPCVQELKKITIPFAAILIHRSFFQTDLSLLNYLFHHYLVPIIIVSERMNEADCVQMLEAGADDFLIKPLHPRELHARISAISRRVLRKIREEQPQAKEVLLFANWRLYPASRRIYSHTNEELQLSVGEYDLLLAFVRQPQCILDRDFLMQVSKNNYLNPFDRRIDVQISRLRQKIETDSKKPALIKTIRNEGYMFTARVNSVKVQ